MSKPDHTGRFAERLLRLALKLPGAKPALRRLLFRDEATLFQEALWRPTLAADEMEDLFGADFERLRPLLRGRGRHVVESLLMEDDHAWLREFLARDGYALLKRVAFAGDQAGFRALARASEWAALKSFLFEDNYRELRALLALRSHEALKAVVFDGDPDIFQLIARGRNIKPLEALLFRDNGALLGDLIRRRGGDGLLPFVTRLDPSTLNALRALIALDDKLEALEPLVITDGQGVAERRASAREAIEDAAHVRGRTLDALTEDDTIHLAHGVIRFSDRHALWTQLHEILLNEDYFFTCDSNTPRIIDGGAHMGLAMYYFKSLYPEARITAFEPVPELRTLAEENATRNGWRDVEILSFALAATRGTATFHRSRSWSMAGSLTPHRAALGESLETIEVECVPLSDYLHDPVDLLKLDIEGAEVEVLEEAAPWLHNVRNLFCEFHDGPELAPGRLGKIIAILEGAGFAVQVGKSNSFQETSRRRPLEHFEGAASMVIWARRNTQHKPTNTITKV